MYFSSALVGQCYTQWDLWVNISVFILSAPWLVAKLQMQSRGMYVCMYVYICISGFCFYNNCSKVHISSATKNALNGEFVLVEAHGRARNEVLKQYDVDTYFVEDNSKTPEVRSCDCLFAVIIN